jgi:hypothetical protein
MSDKITLRIYAIEDRLEEIGYITDPRLDDLDRLQDRILHGVISAEEAWLYANAASDLRFLLDELRSRQE